MVKRATDMRSAFCIGGTHSGCGKTMVSLGIMAALTKRGLRVQPFKVGPDFIDPGHHRRIAGRESHNLDGWMLSRESNMEIFARYMRGADVGVIEGVMGLFDGFSGKDDAGSTAQMAKWLELPVILVIDAGAMARSAAAVATGYANFDPDLNLKGVIFNRAGSSKHCQMLCEGMEKTQIKVYGCLPRDKDLHIPSRHLGLVTDEDLNRDKGYADVLAACIESHLDLDRLLGDTVTRVSSPALSNNSDVCLTKGSKVKVAVARDRAFCFYYAENLRLLKEAGVELVPFSPMMDKRLPQGIRGLYLGGGYPELYCQQLSSNKNLMKEIKEFVLAGGPVYAECGGFMYLMREIQTDKGKSYPMCGVFEMGAIMEPSLRALGYREVRTLRDSIIGPVGTTVRGHEFHYSRIQGACGSVEQIYDTSGRELEMVKGEGFVLNNALGSYVHLHWASNKEVARHFADFCRSHRT